MVFLEKQGLLLGEDLMKSRKTITANFKNFKNVKYYKKQNFPYEK